MTEEIEAAKVISEIYFEIAAEAIGEERVRELRDKKLKQRLEAGQHETIVMRKDQAIDKLRGQLQNCVNHLHNAKRKLGCRYDFDEVIDHANKTLYDTLDA